MTAIDFSDAERRRLRGLAYRMLGSRADAEDVLQDAWIRFSGVAVVRDRAALLTTIVTRLCIDRLRVLRKGRETYVGTWLPEPVANEDVASPETALEIADDLSFALLVALETLSPPQRAAFLLHDVFDLPFAEVSEILDQSEVACRQLASRARKVVRSGRKRTQVGDQSHRELLSAFLTATVSGDLEELKGILAEDATLYSDGGGKALTALNPIRGSDRIARFFIGIMKKVASSGESYSAEFRELANGDGLVILDGDEAIQVFFAETNEGRIDTIFQVCNPDKLVALH